MSIGDTKPLHFKLYPSPQSVVTGHTLCFALSTLIPTHPNLYLSLQLSPLLYQSQPPPSPSFLTHILLTTLHPSSLCFPTSNLPSPLPLLYPYPNLHHSLSTRTSTLPNYMAIQLTLPYPPPTSTLHSTTLLSTPSTSTPINLQHISLSFSIINPYKPHIYLSYFPPYIVSIVISTPYSSSYTSFNPHLYRTHSPAYTPSNLIYTPPILHYIPLQTSSLPLIPHHISIYTHSNLISTSSIFQNLTLQSLCLPFTLNHIPLQTPSLPHPFSIIYPFNP